MELEAQNASLIDDAMKLQENNNTLQLYVNQLRGKLQEVSNSMNVYESTMLVMTSRLKELGALISEQNMENSRK